MELQRRAFGGFSNGRKESGFIDQKGVQISMSYENPIYTASARERLLDLKQWVERALEFDRSMREAGFDDLSRPITQADMDREGLRPGEFVIGNWIIRPRRLEKK